MPSGRRTCGLRGVAEVGVEVRRSRISDAVASLLVRFHFQSPYHLRSSLLLLLTWRFLQQSMEDSIKAEHNNLYRSGMRPELAVF
jgi:hypothetical protein